MKRRVFYAMLFFIGIGLAGCGGSPKVKKTKSMVDERVILLQKTEREVSQLRAELYRSYDDFLRKAKKIMQKNDVE